ncbi:MarR family transcriptional regulator [Agromyces mediolanus]|uniref:MarR family winged helix-turn-helix transcriptional regulator n=1 Tax=Agromyces mediolanus TaxID=41986 RepID=UPI00383980AE
MATVSAGSADGSAELSRLNLLVSPLRRALLKGARAAAELPDIPDAQIELLRAVPRGVQKSPGELATELGLSRSTVSNLLKQLEHAGLVARASQDGDGRRVVVRASERALDLLDRFDRASGLLLGDAVAGLAADERAALLAAVPALERLRGLVEAQSEASRASAARTRP